MNDSLYIDDDLPEEQEVKVEFTEVWSAKDRTIRLIEGAQKSVDTIISTLHQPISLEDLRDERFRQTSEGRLVAIETASKILIEIERLEEGLLIATDKSSGLERKKEYSSSFAEQFADQKEIK